MKVLHLGKFCPPSIGGTEIFTVDLLNFLNKMNIRADLLCFGESTSMTKYSNFGVYRCKTNFVFCSAPLSFDYVRYFLHLAKNYDIIHIHSPNPIAEMLSLMTDRKVIIHWHLDIVRQKFLYKFYRPIQQMALRKAKKVIVTSPNYLQSSVQLSNFRDKAVVIPIGIDFERLEKEHLCSNKFHLKERFKNKKIILSIGRLVEYKGFEYLVEAGKYLSDDVVIIIAGGGDLYEKLKRKIDELSLDKRVFLLGRVPYIAPLLRDCDIFCLPSVTRSEAFGVVLLEAMYFGKPLITTNVYGSGMSYVNVDGRTGLVVPPRDPRALADAIMRILSDEKLYREYSKNSKQRFEEFKIINIAKRVADLYRETLNL